MTFKWLLLVPPGNVRVYSLHVSRDFNTDDLKSEVLQLHGLLVDLLADYDLLHTGWSVDNSGLHESASSGWSLRWRIYIYADLSVAYVYSAIEDYSLTPAEFLLYNKESTPVGLALSRNF